MIGLASDIAEDDTLWDGSGDVDGFDVDAWCGRRVAVHHRIVKHLGSGGMGHVFLAQHSTLGTRAAVKLLTARRTPEAVARFVEEARLLALFHHPNIVQVFDHGELDDGTTYLLMEHVPGVDLECWMRERTLSPERVLHVLRQLARAVDHVHAHGILHRDIKPSNIMIVPTAGDAVKLIDFGIAIREGWRGASDRRLAGTPAYMAPEQAAGGRCSRASDIYAVGSLALEMLTGRPPYAYATMQRVMAALTREPPPLPSERGLRVPGLDAFFVRALARDPRVRFPSARALVDTLEGVLLGSEQRATETRSRPAFSRMRAAIEASRSALARLRLAPAQQLD